jgi:hypothetical protein
VSGLLGTLVWPATVLAVVLVFRRPLVQFVESLQNATVKAGGAEVTLTARAEAAVVAATVDKSGPGPTQPDDIERAIRSTRAATGALPASGLLGRVALWVDDSRTTTGTSGRHWPHSASASPSARRRIRR